jgi:hypothetical protein
MKLPKRVTVCEVGWSRRYPLPDGVQSRLAAK